MINATEDYEVTVSFDDSIAEDKSTEIKDQSQLVLNGLQSKKRAIMKVQGVTEDEALEILAEIMKEENTFDPAEIRARANEREFGRGE